MGRRLTGKIFRLPTEPKERKDYFRMLWGFMIGVLVRLSLVARSAYPAAFVLQLAYVTTIVVIHSLLIAAVVVRLIPVHHSGYWDKLLNFAGIVGLFAGFDFANVILLGQFGIPLFPY